MSEQFFKTHDVKICWIKAGSGEALSMLKAKAADMVMVPSPAAEKEAVKDGWAVKRSLIGFNAFFIVGPEDDPAHISRAKDAAAAFRMISDSNSKYFHGG